jgi:hypothetical protein
MTAAPIRQKDALDLTGAIRRQIDVGNISKLIGREQDSAQ